MNAPIYTDSGAIVPASSGGSVTFVVQHHVRGDAFARYEAWLRKIVAVCSTYPGYQGVDIIRPVSGDNEYSTIVRFATFADAERWCKSTDRPRLIAEITDILEHDDRARIETGIDFWFTPASSRQLQPLRWKQWVVTTTAIWPLMLLIPPLFEPLFASLPWLGLYGIRQAVIASTIVALVVFVIMPRYVRAIAGWLYSGPEGRA